MAAAGAGAATVGTVALTGGQASAAKATAAAGQGVQRSRNAASESVVAYVENPAAGVLRLMVGDREVVVDDADLVTRILNAAGGAA